LTGKVFPRLKKRISQISTSINSTIRSQDSIISLANGNDDSANFEEEEATDYVFRIVTSFKPDNLREYYQCKQLSYANLFFV
jgi:hypothetical protein